MGQVGNSCPVLSKHLFRAMMQFPPVLVMVAHCASVVGGRGVPPEKPLSPFEGSLVAWNTSCAIGMKLTCIVAAPFICTLLGNGITILKLG